MMTDCLKEHDMEVRALQANWKAEDARAPANQVPSPRPLGKERAPLKIQLNGEAAVGSLKIAPVMGSNEQELRVRVNPVGRPRRVLPDREPLLELLRAFVARGSSPKRMAQLGRNFLGAIGCSENPYKLYQFLIRLLA